MTIGLVAFSYLRVGMPLAVESEGSPSPSDHRPPHVNVAVAYDRNALKDSIVVGDEALALTEAGTLLRFRLPQVALSGEYSDAVAVTCIGAHNGIVAAGTANGSVYRVDVATMSLAPIGRVEGKPLWLSPTTDMHGAATVVVTRRTEPREQTDEDGRSYPYDANVLDVNLLPSGRTFRLAGDFNGIDTFLITGRRLFVGEDQGEWGGRCGYLDLDGGRQRWYRSSGVYGLALAGGRVLAFGGTMHMTLTQAFVACIGNRTLRHLYSQDNFHHQTPDVELPEDRPILPISAVVPEATKGPFLVFSYGRVFRVDRGFTKWSDAGRLELKYRTGRPNAVGTLPSIVRVHPLPAGGGYLVTTRLDGYLVVRDGRAGSKAVAHQPADPRFDTLVPFGSGIAFVDSSEAGSPQYVDAGEWRHLPVFPEGLGDDCWFDGFVTPAGDGSLLMKANACVSPGLRVLSRWRDGRAEILRTWESDDWWRDVLGTPDGEIWCLGDGKIRRLSGGDWVDASTDAAGDGAPTDPVDHRIPSVDIVKRISETGPPWFVLDRRLTVEKIDRRLAKLSYDERFRSARLSAVLLDPDDRLDVHDAVALGTTRLLAATSDGLRILDMGTETVSKPDFSLPPVEVRALARDRRGRLWMGGAGLWMLDGTELVDIGAQLAVTGCAVTAIAADPRSDGVVVLLERGMVLFLATGDQD